MENNVEPSDSPVKKFFTSLPGIITAIAGLITAVGGFILILNKTGCMSSKSAEENSKEQPISKSGGHNSNDQATNNGNDNVSTETKATLNVTYSPKQINVISKGVVLQISSVIIQAPGADKAILNLNLKCVNDSKYEYHFYSYNIRIKIAGDNYTALPASPS
jgi:hypothetical protein